MGYKLAHAALALQRHGTGVASLEATSSLLATAVRQARAALERAGVDEPRAVLLGWILRRQLRALDVGHPDDVPAFARDERHPTEALLAAPELAALWLEPTTLGWAYQFWNDTDREAIDRRIGPRGRVQVAELAQKTQLFTERYMATWLVEHSVGRQSGPLESLRVLDPACGAGHLLAAAFDHLVARYRARGDLDDAAVVQRILACNLHGIDLDVEAVRVAAAVLYLCAKRLAPSAALPPLQLVATTFDASAEPDEVRHAVAELAWRGTLAHVPALRAVQQFLTERTPRDDLGVRMTPAPTPAGARFVALLAQRYDTVLSNPPYLATAKIELDASRAEDAFGAMPDLFAAFTRRSLELCRPTGVIAFVALSNWMFLSTFAPVRELLLRGHVERIADLGKGAFRHASKLIQTAMVVASPTPSDAPSLGARVGSRDEIAADQPERIAAALREAGAFQPFDAAHFRHVEGSPFLFWLDPAFLQRYAALPKVGDVAHGAGGIATGDNERFVRAVWEVPPAVAKAALRGESETHLPYLKGASGRAWIEPCRTLLRTPHELPRPGARALVATELGVAYTTIGQRFAARLHSTRSVRDVSGASFFPGAGCSAAELVCALNRKPVRELACALNPTINFQLGDVRRLPYDRVEDAERIVEVLQHEFARHERADERSPAFTAPGASAWSSAKRWAQRQVDRPAGAALEPFVAEEVEPSTASRVSYALGRAFGRFDDDGLCDTPRGARFVVADAAGVVHLASAWRGTEGPHATLDAYLRQGFFAAHRKAYDGRPIYLPLSSKKCSIVVWISVHQLDRSLLGEVQRALRGRPRSAELDELLDTLEQLDLRGPPGREVDAPFDFDLEDGILVHAAALWPLLEPQWKDPKRWWEQLASPHGKRNRDWSKVVSRYFPSRAQPRSRILGS